MPSQYQNRLVVMNGSVVRAGSSLLIEYEPGDVITDLGGTFSRASSAAYFNNLGQRSVVSSDVARDQHYVSGDRCLFLEDQRTNLVLRSAEIDNASWSKLNATISANAALGPNGTLTADKLVESATSAQHQVFSNAVAFVSGTNYCFSVDLKADGRNFVMISLPSQRFGVSASAAVFNLTTGAVVSAETGVTASIQFSPYGNDWYRCSVKKTAIASGSNGIGITLRNTSTNSTYLGDGASGILIENAQCEAGDERSSSIATTSAMVTRASDIISFAGATWASQTVTQYERWYDIAGTLHTLVSVFTGTTPQALTLNRAYTHILVAPGAQAESYFSEWL